MEKEELISTESKRKFDYFPEMRKNGVLRLS